MSANFEKENKAEKRNMGCNLGGEDVDLCSKITRKDLIFEGINRFSLGMEDPHFTHQIFCLKEGDGLRMYYRVGTYPHIFLVVDTVSMNIERVKLSKKKDSDGLEVYGEFNSIVIGRGLITRWVNHPPVVGEQPQVTLYINKPPCGVSVVGPVQYSQLSNKLVSDNFLSAKFRSNLMFIEAIYETLGLIEEKISYEGFFYIDDKLVYSGKKVPRQPSNEEVICALDVIDELGEYLGDLRGEFGKVLKWGIMAPFSFVRKTLSLEFGMMYVYGTSGSGKSVMGRILLFLWNRKLLTNNHTAEEANTPARFARCISQSTYPKIIDEGESLLSSRMEDTFKNGVFNVKVRGRYNPSTFEYEESPALNPLYITSNKLVPTKAEIGRRIYPVEVRMSKSRDSEEILEFEERFRSNSEQSPLRVLGVIGDFVTCLVLDDPSYILENDWVVGVDRILDRLYGFAGRRVPGWLRDVVLEKGYSVAFEEEQNDLISMLKYMLLENVKLSTYLDEDSRVVSVSERDKLLFAVKNSVVPWIYCVEYNSGAYSGESHVLITREFCIHYRRVTGENISLKLLADYLGASYGYRNGESGRTRVVRMGLDEFLDRCVG